MSKVEFFKKEDFDHRWPHGNLAQIISTIANEKLSEKLIHVVYFKFLGGKPFNLGPEINQEDDTHKAYLFNIEEIKEEECKHRPHVIEIFPDLSRSPITCQYCGVELEATWSAKK